MTEQTVLVVTQGMFKFGFKMSAFRVIVCHMPFVFG
jgi:hypothetical protein